MTLHLPFRTNSDANFLRIAALALLAIPTAILLLFAIGEVVGGDVSGLQHVPEAALLLGLMFFAWRHPLGTGIALLAIGSVLLVVWSALVLLGEIGGEGDSRVVVWLAAGGILFLPPLAAGALLLRASREL